MKLKLSLTGGLLASTAALFLAACGGGTNETASGPTESAAKVGSLSSQGVSVEALRIAEVDAVSSRIAPSLLEAKGLIEVWVSLADPSLAVKQRELRPDAAGRNWKATDAALQSQLKSHKQLLQGKQNSAMASLSGMGAVELGRVHVSHNAIAVKIDAARLRDIEAMDGVIAVRPVRHYELMLGETVPYVGGASAQSAGKDGTGVRVAVLDSGIDYTHRNMGGAGTAAAYAAAWGTSPADPLNTTTNGLFPTAKVVDGFDFVGETWTPTTGTRTEDPDPIDYGRHGTHVADIIAGIGPNKGMAPGAKLVAVKVCSAVSSSCNGVALIKGMDFALDPNGDGDLSDAVDVINLSLGSSYGQDEDDLSFATSNAVKLGVSVVASAGNSANRPYITGSPSSALGVLSVAQTQVPSANAFPLVVNSPASIAGSYANTATLEFAPIGAGVSGNVAFIGRGCPATATSPADPFSSSPAGKIALIDRGACSISLKVDRAVAAGATGVLIGLVAAGDATTFSFGGGTNFAPSLVIQQSLATSIKANILAPVNVTISPAGAVSLAGSVVGSSSRGPNYSRSSIKPEIGAPGASLSAEATTGTGETVFGGTSGAAPMVAGAAAILRAEFPDRSPAQIKAMLMNSANTAVYTNPALLPGVLAPISRIGAGELRVARALALKSVAYDKKALSAAVSFGFAEVSDTANLGGQLVIENFTNASRTYTLATSYRYANDAASGATSIELPSSVTVPANGSSTIDIRMKVDGTKLPAWNFGNAGSTGGNGALLDGNEVDGYVSLTADGEALSVPFHALLRKSAALSVTAAAVKVGNAIGVKNNAANAGEFDVFALTGTSGQISKNLLPDAGDNAAVIDLRAVGVRAVGTNLQFAVTRWDRRAHPAYPAEIDIYVDSNGDGVDDYVIYNAESGAFASTGQTLVNVFNLATNANRAFFFLDTDLQSKNGIFTVPMSALGITPSSRFKFSVYAIDNYFTGNVTDAIEGMTHTLGTPRYSSGALSAAVPGGATERISTAAMAGGDTASPSQSGFLLMYRQNKEQHADVVTVNP